MEIERKFLINNLPEHLEQYKHKHIAQGYLCTNPVVRVRKSDNEYYMTYKGSGMLAREEYNLPLNEEAYNKLVKKIDGRLIEKTRYLIPLDGGLVAELDIFEGVMYPLQMVEVEFESIEAARAFVAPKWFGEDVTDNPKYHNSNMSIGGAMYE